MTSPGNGSRSDSTTVCFAVEHTYGADATGDHMIRVVSPNGVYAEEVGTPGAELEIRAPQDEAGTGSGNGSVGTPDAQVPGSAPQGGAADSGAAQRRATAGQSGQSDQREDASDGGDSSAAQGELKLRPETTVGLRAIVVFPSGKADDEVDVTNSAEWKSTKPDVARVNTSTGIRRGELTTVEEGSTTVSARHSGLVARRKVKVLGRMATAMRIESATGETSVAKGAVLPLRATVTFDSGESEQATDDVAWSSSDSAVADVDSGGEVEGVAAGEATITGKYRSKDGDELSSELDVTVTDSNGGGGR